MTPPRLSCEGLARRYRDVEALRDVTLDARAGEVLAVLGASGSGKSTLLRLLHLLERPDAGVVRLDGEVVPEGPRRLAALRRLALVQQRPGLLRMDALRNAAFATRARGVPRSEAEARALAWLERLGLAARARTPAHRLSGGEAQRVALAGALATRSDALLLDEATNQLDPAGVRLVEGILREEAARGCAVVLVTHQVAQARRVADRFVLLEKGIVAEAGDVSRLDAPQSDALASFLAFG